jgi:hypothetical protein
MFIAWFPSSQDPVSYGAVLPEHQAKASTASCALSKTLTTLKSYVVASPNGGWSATVEQTDPVVVPYGEAQACVNLRSGAGMTRSVTVRDFRTLEVTWISDRLLYLFTDVGHVAGVGQLLDADALEWLYAKTEYYSPSSSKAPPRQPDEVVILAAKRADVQEIDPKIDPKQPRLELEAWLRRVLGPQPRMTWEVNDCGEQSGNPAIDKGRDFPMCVEIHVALADKRDLYVSIMLGTFATGLSGRPALRHAVVNAPDGRMTWIKTLSDVPAAIR